MFLITGTGCSGTGWMSQFFNELGFACGHELWFKHPDPQLMRGSDSSWLAVPFLPDIDDSVRIVHLIRNPLNVVRSVYASGFLSDNPVTTHWQFVSRHRFDIDLSGDHLSRVIRYVLHWDESVHIWRTTYPFHIESSDNCDKLSKMVTFATDETLPDRIIREAQSRVPNNVNSHRGDHDMSFITWQAILEYEHGHELYAKAEKLGYV